MNRILTLLVLCCLCSQLSAQTYTLETVPDPKQSPSSHYVSNPAGILSAATVARMDSVLGRLEDSATAQVAVVVLPSIGEAVPKDFANELFKKWGVGQASKDNGLLVLFVLDQRRVEFETGYGLEGVLPDIVCGRIQREHMVPAFKNGDYNAGMQAGMDAIAETLLQPEVVQEIQADEIYGAEEQAYIGRMDNDDLLVLPFLLSFFFLILRFLRWILRSVNAVKRQVDEAIRKKSDHYWLGLLLYCITPMTIGVLLNQAFSNIDVAWGWGFLASYAYLAFLVWYSRVRRMRVFHTLFGQMSEPQQYVRLQTFARFYWFDALCFPLPFLWIWYKKNQDLERLRNHPRYSPEGYPLTKIPDRLRERYLSPHQKVEESLKTVEYDIWQDQSYQFVEAVGYEALGMTKYTCCEACRSKAVLFEKEEILKAATLEADGRSKKYYRCKACSAESSKEILLPMIKPTPVSTGSSGSSSGGSSWSSSSYSSGSSGSSWGGGRSGGGGAGSSW